VAYIIPIPFLFLELLVGVIQALIFSILLVVYFTIAASDHEEHESIQNETNQVEKNEPAHIEGEKELVKELIKEIG
jgi:hypothetical protein